MSKNTVNKVEYASNEKNTQLLLQKINALITIRQSVK